MSPASSDTSTADSAASPVKQSGEALPPPNGGGNTAFIDIQLTRSFVPVLDAAGGRNERLTGATWTLRQPAPDGITQAAANATLVFMRAMKFDFVLPAASGCVLAGIVFRQTEGTGPSDGKEDMPKEHITLEQDAAGSTVHAKNVFKNKGSGRNRWTWDFYIIIQNHAGDIGIIDPDIENRDSTL